MQETVGQEAVAAETALPMSGADDDSAEEQILIKFCKPSMPACARVFWAPAPACATTTLAPLGVFMI